MKVYLIGKTQVDLFPFRGDSRHVMPGKAEGSAFEKRVKDDHPYSPESGEELIEFAGRLCYESFDLPNKHTASNSNYVRSLIAKGHESVLEHVSVTFYVEGVSRNLSHELIRHRHLSFSELSQRYVGMEGARYVIPPLFQENEGWPELIEMPGDYVENYQHNYWLARDEYGETGKAARQAARYVLPGATETKFVVSGNLRAWRDVLKKRHSVHADAEMQRFAAKVLEVLSAEYPDVFADIEYQED